MILGQSGLIVANTAAAGDWWDITGVVAAWQPKGAASYAASLLDISGNGNDATEGVAPSWDATNGWTFNGSSQWLDSGLRTTVAYSLAVSVANVNTSGASQQTAIGDAWQGLRPHHWGTVRYNGQAAAAGSASAASAVLVLTGTKGYLNGAEDATGITIGTLNRKIALGAEGYSTSPTGNWFDGSILAVAVFSSVLTAEEVATLSAAMAAL